MTPGLAPLHAGAPALGDLTLGVLVLAALGSATLLGLGLAAFARRGSRSYLLVVLALGALFARSGVAWLSATGLLDPAPHHLLEHGLDVAMAALVVGAVYYARTVERDLPTEGRA